MTRHASEPANTYCRGQATRRNAPQVLQSTGTFVKRVRHQYQKGAIAGLLSVAAQLPKMISGYDAAVQEQDRNLCTRQQDRACGMRWASRTDTRKRRRRGVHRKGSAQRIDTPHRNSSSRLLPYLCKTFSSAISHRNPMPLLAAPSGRCGGVPTWVRQPRRA